MIRPQSYREAGSCQWTRLRIAMFVKGWLPAREQQQVRRHLGRCLDCAEHVPDTQSLRKALQALPDRVPPADLNLRLRVIASREASLRKEGGRFTRFRRKLQRWSDELMRPLAIPTAGGFASALLLFSMLAPSLAVRAHSAGVADIPTGLYTEASVKSSLPFGFDGQDVLVEVYVDGSGRMVEYTIPYPHASSPEVRRNIENHLLTMVFNPATTFGQPISGKLRVWFRTSRIDVRG